MFTKFKPSKYPIILLFVNWWLWYSEDFNVYRSKYSLFISLLEKGYWI